MAILVDDLAAWIASGRHPTGIQRVVTGVIDAATARKDAQVWLAVSAIGLRDKPTLRVIDRGALQWAAPGAKLTLAARTLRSSTRLVRPVPMPRRFRRTAKAIFAALAVSVVGHDRAAGPAAARLPTILLVPGSFSTGDGAEHLRRLAEAGVRIRIVVHDLFPLTNPEWCNAELAWSFRRSLDLVAPIVDRVLTLSGAAADVLVGNYPALADRVRIAVPGLEAFAPSEGNASHGGPRRVPGEYLLVVGTVEPRKNHRVVLDAWRQLSKRPEAQGISLVIAGRRGWGTADLEGEMARDAARSRIVRLEGVGDELVGVLYRDCLATVLPSWAEGFGIPVRESVARGIPTLMSTGVPTDGLPTGSYRLFDPADAAGLTDLMAETIAHGRIRQRVDLAGGTGWEPIVSALLD